MKTTKLTISKQQGKKFTSEEVEQFCDDIAEGKSLQKTAEQYGLDRSNLYRILNRQENRERYLAALNQRAMKHAEHIEFLAMECEQGRIDPKAADVSIRARMWICSKYHPELLAERTSKTVNVEHSMRQEHLDTMKKIAKRKAQMGKEEP